MARCWVQCEGRIRSLTERLNVAEGGVRRLIIRSNVSMRKRVLKVDSKVLENRTATIKDGKGYELSISSSCGIVGLSNLIQN